MFLIERIVLNPVTSLYVGLVVPTYSILTRSRQGAQLLDFLGCVETVVGERNAPISGPSVEPMRLIEDVSRTMEVRSPGARAGASLAQIVSQLPGTPWPARLVESQGTINEWSLQLEVPLNDSEGYALFSSFVAPPLSSESDSSRFEDPV
jgi:hypothetical protein